MRRNHGAAALGLATASILMAALVSPVGPATAGSTSTAPTSAPSGSDADVTPVGPDFNHGKALPLDRKEARSTRRAAPRKALRAAHDAAVGDQKIWLTLDDYQGSLGATQFTLKGLGNHIQVWVADDTAFPAGDCRESLGLSTITQAQVDNFVHEFDTNIYPKESKAFSVPPSLNGADAPATSPNFLNLPADYYEVSGSQADDIVVLVDNVKDANYYKPNTPDGQTYIAGFFYSAFNDLTNRNVMTIDAFDWRHRTGANPPDDSGQAAYKACAAQIGRDGLGGSDPRLYEGTFAHEYQHLLENYSDADETSWVNEGLSDYAQTLVGYVKTNQLPTAKTADGHISCFQGYQDESFGGPENSLTLWQDQGAPEVLCDYGAAYSFMMYLAGHYGQKFMSRLHREKANGLAGLGKTLRRVKAKRTAMQTLHDWQVAMATDHAIDRSGKVFGASKRWLTSSRLKSEINWANPQAYNSPGAPPNGADYVRLGTPGNWLRASQVNGISFKGATSLRPDPVRWKATTKAPTSTGSGSCGSLATGTTRALYSGCGENFDRSIVRAVTVPKKGGRLSFQALWDTEPGWDYGYVQVSANGGRTWRSLATQGTTKDHDPGAVKEVVSQLPGFTGDSGSWKTQTASLSRWKGKRILIGFRYITDPGTNEGGFWVRGIKAAGKTLPSGSIRGWRTITQVHPQAVPGWTVQLIGISKGGAVWYHRLELNKSFRGSLSGAELRKALGGARATTVAALVTVNDPREKITKYGRYHLTVRAPVGMGHRQG